MNQQTIDEQTMMIITYGGSARSSALQAIDYAKQGDYTQAESLLDEANHSLKEANRYQEQVIQKEIDGTFNLNLLMVHAQDHYMNALTIVDLAEKFVDMYKERS